MDARAPRHRAPKSPRSRRAERHVVLALITFPFQLAFLSWFAVRTENVVLLIVSVIGALIGTRLNDQRKTRRRERAARQQS